MQFVVTRPIVGHTRFDADIFVGHTQFDADWPFQGFMSSAVDACDQTKTRSPLNHEDRRKLEGIKREHMREVRRTREQYAAAIQYAHLTYVLHEP